MDDDMDSADEMAEADEMEDEILKADEKNTRRLLVNNNLSETRRMQVSNNIEGDKISTDQKVVEVTKVKEEPKELIIKSPSGDIVMQIEKAVIKPKKPRRKPCKKSSAKKVSDMDLEKFLGIVEKLKASQKVIEAVKMSQ